MANVDIKLKKMLCISIYSEQYNNESVTRNKNLDLNADSKLQAFDLFATPLLHPKVPILQPWSRFLGYEK